MNENEKENEMNRESQQSTYVKADESIIETKVDERRRNKNEIDNIRDKCNLDRYG